MQQIDKMEGEYLKKWETVQSLASCLDELTVSMQRIANTTDEEMELGLTLQEEIKAIQKKWRIVEQLGILCIAGGTVLL